MCIVARLKLFTESVGLASVKKKKEEKINWDFWDLAIKQCIGPDVKS